MVRCTTWNIFHQLQFCRCFNYLAWFDAIEINRLMCPNDMMYDDEISADRFRYPLAMLGSRLLIGLSRLHHAHNAYEIYTAKLIAAFCRISYCFVWFYTVEFNRMPCPNDKMYDDAAFDVRFRYPFTMFGNRVLTALFGLLHAHIAYEINTSQFIAAFCRIDYCLHYLIPLNSIACHA